MAILIYQTDSGRVPGLEYLPSGAITPKTGMALKLTAGKLAVAAGADTPLYLSMTERSKACTAGQLIPVIRAAADIIFETETPAGFTAAVGDKVQLKIDGCGLSAAAGGPAEIVYTDSERTRFRLGKTEAAASTAQ